MAKSNTTDQMISEYRKILEEDDGVNKKVRKLADIYFKYPKEQAHEEACYLFRFFFEEIAGWTPEVAMASLDKTIIKEMKLERAFNNIIFPNNLNPDTSCFWIACACYPEHFRSFSERNYQIMEYNQILSSGLNSSKKVFQCDNGREKAALFLNVYYTSRGIREEFTDLENMYLFFASSKAKKYIHEAALDKALAMFFISPLEFFHESLPNSRSTEEKYQRSEFLYMYADFMTKIGENPFDKKKKRKKKKAE